jgi:hypothetical protein
MLNAEDREKFFKTAMVTKVLIRELQRLCKTKNLLLHDIANNLLQQVIPVAERMNYIVESKEFKESPELNS